MSKELLLVMEAVANEKGVPRAVIIEAMEAALASAAKKRYHEQDVTVRVAIDPKDGSYETFRRWEVVADDVVMESPDRQIRLMDAVDEKEGAEVGDFVEEQVENAEFGRIAAQAAKQVISLPLFPHTTTEDCEYIVGALKSALVDARGQ